MKLFSKAALLIALLSVATACSTWNNMNSQEKGAVIGVGAGAVAGAALTDGRVLGTGAGAALGGLIGNEVGKEL